MAHHLLGSDLVAVAEVPVRVLLTVVKEVLVDEGEMVLAAVVVKRVVSTVSIPTFCSSSRMAWYQSAVVS